MRKRKKRKVKREKERERERESVCVCVQERCKGSVVVVVDSVTQANCLSNPLGCDKRGGIP